MGLGYFSFLTRWTEMKSMTRGRAWFFCQVLSVTLSLSSVNAWDSMRIDRVFSPVGAMLTVVYLALALVFSLRAFGLERQYFAARQKARAGKTPSNLKRSAPTIGYRQHALKIWTLKSLLACFPRRR